MLVINGVELEVNMGDADFQEKYENAFNKMEESEKKLQKVGKISEITRGYCKLFYSLFDDIFGEGTGEKIFEGKHEIKACNEAYDKFIAECAEQAAEIQKSMTGVTKKYTPKKRK